MDIPLPEDPPDSLEESSHFKTESLEETKNDNSVEEVLTKESKDIENVTKIEDEVDYVATHLNEVETDVETYNIDAEATNVLLDEENSKEIDLSNDGPASESPLVQTEESCHSSGRSTDGDSVQNCDLPDGESPENNDVKSGSETSFVNQFDDGEKSSIDDVPLTDEDLSRSNILAKNVSHSFGSSLMFDLPLPGDDLCTADVAPPGLLDVPLPSDPPSVKTSCEIVSSGPETLECIPVPEDTNRLV